MKTVYYYQTFIGLEKLLTHVEDIDTIIISSIHFDKDKQENKQIYLNDNLPDNPKFNTMWMETKEIYDQGKLILLMVGGAGGAYSELFSDFETYYPLLRDLLREKTYIGGIDLDIEEGVSLDNVKMLIRKLNDDFGKDFILTMAPIAGSMITDDSGMGGFSYKELSLSEEGKRINWYHVQCYQSFSKDTYDQIIKNKWKPEQIVMGMMSGQFTKDTFKNALQEGQSCLKAYPEMCGVFVWEYIDSPPDMNDPSQWCRMMKNPQEYLDSVDSLIEGNQE